MGFSIVIPAQAGIQIGPRRRESKSVVTWAATALLDARNKSGHDGRGGRQGKMRPCLVITGLVPAIQWAGAMSLPH